MRCATRLRHLGAGGVQARTFHSAALRQLRYFWPRKHGVDLPVLTESKIGMIAGAARRLRVESDQALLRDLASEVEWAKVSNVGPDNYPRSRPAAGARSAARPTRRWVASSRAYEQVKRDQGRMDMEDVLLLTAGLLAEDERVAAQVRRQYKWFVVDEFQDVSRSQSALLDLWLGGRHELCVVGDPAQTIYSFAGANARYLHDFTGKHPGARQPRARPQLPLHPRGGRRRATPCSTAPPARVSTCAAQRPSGPPATFSAHPDEVAEASAVADRIVALRDQAAPRARWRCCSGSTPSRETFEEALASAGRPYVVRGAARFFERQEVRQAVTLLRGTARSGEGTGDVASSVRDTLSGLGMVGDVRRLRGQTRDRWESLQALVDQAIEFARPQSGADLGAFVDELDRRASEQHAPAAAGVTLATLHAAKGLEWDAVFLGGPGRGHPPIIYAEGPAAVEEERRCLRRDDPRAGSTSRRRGRWAATPAAGAPQAQPKFLDGSGPPMPPSPPPGAAGRAAATRGALDLPLSCGRPLSNGARRRPAAARTPASYDEELFDRLRAWRLARGGRRRGAAFVVFTDATSS